ncbi:uncharacterized protein LOC123305049 [Chrysoperla carnea]|uniref:uncharacterized protein LOC123305049 n=1 Tax=Chrysoperla carnea TaxID=189513 RepID=UPI001D06984D|nr:uncharacterized protein LOC123305049 [Chrysoperla carnea]
MVNIQHKLSLFPKFTVVLQISRCSCYQRRYYQRNDKTRHYSTTQATQANAKTCYVTTTITHYLVYQTTTITTNTNKYLLNKIKYFYQYSIYCTYSTIFKNNNGLRSHLNGVVRCNNETTTNLISITAKNITKMWKFATRTFKEAFSNGTVFGCGNGSGTSNGVTSYCRCTLNNIYNNDEQQLLLQSTSTLSDNNEDNENNLVVTDESPNIKNNFNYCLYKNLYQISFKCSNTLQSLGWYINHFLSLQQNSAINKPQIKQTPVNHKELIILDTKNYKKIGIRLADLTLTATPKLSKTIITNALNPQIIETFQLKDVKTKNNSQSSLSTENNTIIVNSTSSTTESFIDLKSNITKNEDPIRQIEINVPKNDTNNSPKTTETQNTKNKNEQAIEDAAARFAFVTGVLENQLGAAYLKQQQKTNNSNLDIALGHFEAGTLYKNASAAFNLGLCYELGIGTKQNYQAAAKCYKTAIELGGHTKAMYNLAIYYIKGLGDLPQDFNLAYQLFLNAAQKGHLQSIQALHSVKEYNNKNVNNKTTTSLQEKQLLTC